MSEVGHLDVHAAGLVATGEVLGRGDRAVGAGGVGGDRVVDLLLLRLDTPGA